MRVFRTKALDSGTKRHIKIEERFVPHPAWMAGLIPSIPEATSRLISNAELDRDTKGR